MFWHRKLLAVLIAPLVMSTLAARPAAAEDVVHYPMASDSLPGATVHADQGRKLPDGRCEFVETGRGDGRPAGSPQVRISRTLSVEPGTCLRRTARAQYPADAVPASVTALLDRSDKAKDQTTTSEKQVTTDRAAPAAAGSWNGSIHGMMLDPFDIPVTETISELFWSFDGALLSASHRSAWEWVWGVGWYLDLANYSHPNNGTVASTNTFGYFVNYIFPPNPFEAVWAEHAVTYFAGDHAGGWAYEFTVIWGGEGADRLTPIAVATTPS
jgi:hypothetical protein